jgi:flavin-dependent dehydrogenase
VLSRATLDAALLQAAREAGAEVLQPVRVRGIDHDGERVIASLDGGATIEADIVVHADGSGRLDGSAAGVAARVTPAREGVLGRKCHVRLPGDRQVCGLRMRSAAGAYVGMVGVEDGMSTVALVARRELIARFDGDADAMLAHLWPGYEARWRCSPWLACGVAGSGYIAGSHARSFRAGNAAAAVEPVGGEGIGLALWSGAVLGRLLPAAGEPLDASSLAMAQGGMARAYRARVRARRPACRLAAELLMRPWLLRGLWPMLAIPGLRSALIGPWYAATGKPV